MSSITSIYGMRTARPVVIITKANNSDARDLAQYLSHHGCFVILITANRYFSDCDYVCKTLDSHMVLRAHLITYAEHYISASALLTTAWQRIVTCTLVDPRTRSLRANSVDKNAILTRKNPQTLVIHDSTTSNGCDVESMLTAEGFKKTSMFRPSNMLASSYVDKVREHLTKRPCLPPANIITPPVIIDGFAAAHIVTPEPNTTTTMPLLNVWLPCECEEERTRYDPAAKEFWFRALKRVPEAIREHELSRLYTLAPREPRFLKPKAPLPLVVLIHGFQGWPGVYSQIARALASIGYAVIGITNPQHAAVVQTPSNTYFQHIPHSELFKSHMADLAVKNNLGDIQRVLQNISDSPTPFFDKSTPQTQFWLDTLLVALPQCVFRALRRRQGQS